MPSREISELSLQNLCKMLVSIIYHYDTATELAYTVNCHTYSIQPVAYLRESFVIKTCYIPVCIRESRLALVTGSSMKVSRGIIFLEKLYLTLKGPVPQKVSEIRR
jgi:hypothetical protein